MVQLRHIGIIPDGNRRWARARGLPVFKGHERGAEVLKNVINFLINEAKIPFITVYVFSLKNFNRSEEEKKYLFKLFERFLPEIASKAEEYGYSVVFAGRKEKFPRWLAAKMKDIIVGREKAVVLLVGYDGLDDLEQAFEKAKNNGKNFRENCFIPDWVPEIDAVVRTSEKRLSGFPPYLTTYSELFFLEKYWPEVTVQDFRQVLAEYSRRERRFGR